MQQQSTTATEGLTRQNGELQAELAPSRQQAANEIAALRLEMRARQCGPQMTGGSRRGHEAVGKAR